MPTALDDLAALHRPMLLCYARALVGRDLHRAEDIVQETFLTAQRRKDDFREGADFGRWLRGIARNKVLEAQRAAAQGPVVVDSEVIAGMDEVFALFDPAGFAEESWKDQLLRWLSDCIARLSPPLREAIDRVYREGLSLREAATALSSSPAAVAQRVSRARDLIRLCVQTRREGET